MIAYKYGWKRGLDFNGRSTREEYFGFILVNTLVIVFLSRLEAYTGLFIGDDLGIISTLYQLAVFVPALALNARRLADINKPFGYVFLNIIPLIGNAYYLYLMLSPSTKQGYYKNEEQWPEAQESNRSQKIILFFLFAGAIFVSFNWFMSFTIDIMLEAKSAYRVLMRSEVYNQVMTILLTYSLVYVLKDKRARTWGFIFASVIAVWHLVRIWKSF